MIITAIIIFFTLLNSLNFIVGTLSTPKNSVFLGTTHWPGDYFYYLSQFAQGKESWFGGYDLYTSDFRQKTYVGWVNVFIGRVFHLFGVNQFWAYQISTVVFTLLFLWLSYLLLKEIIDKDKGKRTVAFALFNFANTWPTGADYWFNNGIPFVRLVGVPHQMLGKAMLVAALLLFIKWVKGRRKVWMLLATGLVSIILVSVEPVHWILVIITFIISYLLISISLLAQRNRGKKERPGGDFLVSLTLGIAGGPRLSYFIIPGLLFFLFGFPMFMYLKKLFSFPPYSQLAAWEATQQQYVGVWHFLASNGPVALLAVLGIIFLIKNDNFGMPGGRVMLSRGGGYLLMLVFTILTVFLFFSPIPKMINIVNVRFLPAVTSIFFAALATEAIDKLPKKRLILGLIFVLLLFPLPSQIKKRITFDANNAYFFLPQSVMVAFDNAEKISNPHDTFLVIWPFNVTFPGITGRRVYEGHHLLTIDAARKDELEWKFFDGQMSNAQMHDFLAKERIDFIISYSWTGKLEELKELQKVYDNGYLTLYKIIKGL